jgi:hypothetical protein
MTMLLYPYRIQVLIYTLINFLVSTVTRQEFHFILEKNSPPPYVQQLDSSIGPKTRVNTNFSCKDTIF